MYRHRCADVIRFEMKLVKSLDEIRHITGNFTRLSAMVKMADGLCYLFNSSFGESRTNHYLFASEGKSFNIKDKTVSPSESGWGFYILLQKYKQKKHYFTTLLSPSAHFTQLHDG